MRETRFMEFDELPDDFEPLIGLAVGYSDVPLGTNAKEHDPIGVNRIG